MNRQGAKDAKGLSILVDAVDLTGAVEAFDAGYFFGWLAGRPTQECLMWRNACGALTGGCPGGSGALENRGEIQAFIRSRAGS